MAVSKFFVGAYETANFAQVPHHITHNTSQHTTLHCTRSLNPPLTSPSFPYPSYPFLISHLPYETANFAQVTAHHTTQHTALHCTALHDYLRAPLPQSSPPHLTLPCYPTFPFLYLPPPFLYLISLLYLYLCSARPLPRNSHTPLS